MCLGRASDGHGKGLRRATQSESDMFVKSETSNYEIITDTILMSIFPVSSTDKQHRSNITIVFVFVLKKKSLLMSNYNVVKNNVKITSK